MVIPRMCLLPIPGIYYNNSEYNNIDHSDVFTHASTAKLYQNCTLIKLTVSFLQCRPSKVDDKGLQTKNTKSLLLKKIILYLGSAHILYILDIKYFGRFMSCGRNNIFGGESCDQYDFVTSYIITGHFFAANEL